MALEVAVAAIKIFIVVNVVQLVVAYMIYVERKVIAHAQLRLGPMRVGWHGLLQPIADGLKLFFKEDIVPDKADRVVFVLAPVMVLVPALVVYAVLPFSATYGSCSTSPWRSSCFSSPRSRRRTACPSTCPRRKPNSWRGFTPNTAG